MGWKEGGFLYEKRFMRGGWVGLRGERIRERGAGCTQALYHIRSVRRGCVQHERLAFRVRTEVEFHLYIHQNLPMQIRIAGCG